MSKKRIEGCCIVIDASIARAAGAPESRHPTGVRCREFLLAVRSICHRMAWNAAIRTEWDRHQSQFATQWRQTMMNLRKLRPVSDTRLEELRARIEAHSKDKNIVALMLKDAHLVEAATESDGRVSSLDDTVRGHLAQLAAKDESLRQIIWVNPAIEAERAVEWLEKGAPRNRSRRLS